MPSLTPENYRIILNRLIDHDAEKVSHLDKVVLVLINLGKYGRIFKLTIFITVFRSKFNI